jgi:hypothetical protein
MTMTVDDLRDVLGADFTQMCAELAEARSRQNQKDTASNRVCMTTCQARIDTLLDLYLEMGRAAA